LKRFFVWLAGQPGFRSRISYSDAEYFNLSVKETRIAKAHREGRVPTLEQIRHVIQMMPARTEIEERDRAIIAFTILTGARDGATASIKLQHIDIAQGRLDQDARQVNTKFSKTFTTWFFPVGGDILEIVADWVAYLRQKKLWGLDDPLFPATKIALRARRHFEASPDDYARDAGGNVLGDLSALFVGELLELDVIGLDLRSKLSAIGIGVLRLDRRDGLLLMAGAAYAEVLETPGQATQGSAQCRTRGLNGAAHSYCRTLRCIRLGSGAVSGSAAAKLRARSQTDLMATESAA